jgi:hypothetical protein
MIRGVAGAFEFGDNLALRSNAALPARNPLFGVRYFVAASACPLASFTHCYVARRSKAAGSGADGMVQ